VRNRGRSQSSATRSKIAAKLKAYRREQALAADYVHPLRLARLEAGLTQSGLASKALVDLSVIQRLETGVASKTSRLTAERLGRALNVPADSLT